MLAAPQSFLKIFSISIKKEIKKKQTEKSKMCWQKQTIHKPHYRESVGMLLFLSCQIADMFNSMRF